ncbi:hypothetical protein [Thalassospira sp. TSL5-1]|uniref:hypothetical protein n=1 Tax=Thalassospira sp. TSL5-1 TaxID=1544451 RepID=UPI0009401F07|nr:hypothetical protein [Thalassospira sp. TSL5-1]OKH89569.1 hypothetical protein LF95_06350 [Thalassospira sp. TSL5-1]
MFRVPAKNALKIDLLRDKSAWVVMPSPAQVKKNAFKKVVYLHFSLLRRLFGAWFGHIVVERRALVVVIPQGG